MRDLVFVLACTGIALLPLIAGGPASDLVPHFPGWDNPLPSKVFSGFIDSDEKGWMHTHYVFVESENDPANDPVLLWFNGGPGASSLFGFFIELGPFMLTGASLQTEAYNNTGIPTVFYNPYTWSKISNLLIVNSPPPVGFSYCDTYGPSGNGSSCGDWNDNRTAQTNHLFLKNWLKAFPEYASHPVYISGESYAGVYVPTLVREIITDPDNTINIKGFAVGDACMGKDVLCGDHDGPYWDIMFMYGHGQFSSKLYDAIMQACPKEALITGNGISQDCAALLADVETEIGGFYEYNLYDECWYENAFLAPKRKWTHTLNPTEPRRSYWGPPHIPSLSSLSLHSSVSQLNDYSCGGPLAMTIYLNNSIVREALHIPLDAFFFSQDDGNDFNYTLTERDLQPFYIHVATNTQLRALVYNGDADPGINSFISQNWTASLGLKEIEGWRPWTLDGKQRMGGYVTSYEGDFSFLTIRGSGHMVPEFKPPAALEFLTRWLRNEDWKPYVGPSTSPTQRRSLVKRTPPQPLVP